MKKAISEWFVKNKIKIIMAVILILVIFLVNRLFVFIEMINRQNTSLEESIISSSSKVPQYNSIALDSTDSVTMGSDMSQNQTELLRIIDQFITYCNEQRVDEAYSILSDECKEELYPNVDDFRNSYYNKVFNGHKKNVSIENWNENIYKISINEDSLSTGQFTESNSLQDFIRIIGDSEGNPKLNINSYVGKEELQKTGSNRNVEITAIESDIYMDYQKITFRVINNTDSEIMIDDKIYSETMYIEDENGIKYPSYSHEINDAELRLSPKQTKEITIKYYSSYGTRKNITSAVFSGVVYNYTAYSENTSIAKDYGNITINMK